MFSLVPFSAVNESSSFAAYEISSLDKSTTSSLFCGLVCILGTVLFFLLLAYKYQIVRAIMLGQNSIACNLRGFILETNFALDYSEAHGLDEGLCYSFTTTNSVFDSSSQ